MAEKLSRPKTWLVVGASRGIGHEFVRQLLTRGDDVYATVRGSIAKYDASHWTTDQSAKLTVLSCDMLSEDSVDVRSKVHDVHCPDEG